jgi:hypothetical protein
MVFKFARPDSARLARFHGLKTVPVRSLFEFHASLTGCHKVSFAAVISCPKRLSLKELGDLGAS